MNTQENAPSVASVGTESTPNSKQEYQKPFLKTYGLVKNLTQGSGSGGVDGGQSRGSPKF